MARISESGAVDPTHKIGSSIELAGTSYRGKVTATYQQLSEVFGEPDIIKGTPESLYEWWIETPDGIASVHDQSRYAEYGFDVRADGRPWQWHVGGHTANVVTWIQQAVHGAG